MRRLGRKPANLAAVSRAPRHVFGAIPAPKKLDRANTKFAPELYRNDTLSNCVPVAIANAARGVAALNGYDLVVDPATVPQFYSTFLGNPPDLEAADGCVMLDVMNYQAEHGYFIGPQSLVGLHGTLSPMDRNGLALGMSRFGPTVLGVTLRERDMELLPVWDVQDGRNDGDIVGGHAVISWDYTGTHDQDTLRIGTWGEWQPATWEWLADRLVEAYALVWRQLERADGLFYAGIKPDDLASELEC